MKYEKRNEPAYPCEVYYREDGTFEGIQTGSKSGIHIGLTKLEYFTAVALQGICSAEWAHYASREILAAMAVEAAEAALSAISEESISSQASD